MQQIAKRPSRASLRLVASRRFTTTKGAPGRHRAQIVPPMSRPAVFVDAARYATAQSPGEVTIGHKFGDGAVFLHRPDQPCPQCDVA